MDDMFEQLLKNVPQEVWLKITEIEAMSGQWKGGVGLHPQILSRLKKSVLVTSTGASTRIEGSKLSDEQIEKMLKGLTIQKFANRDEQEVTGYFELLENVFESWSSLKFNESLIKHFHKELLKYVEKDDEHRGNYKQKENTVVMLNETGEPVGTLFETTKAYLTAFEMKELVDWTINELEQKKHHPILVIGVFVVEFLKIHPFEDGNGRLSRILTNLLLLQNGYLYIPYVSQEKLIEDNKQEYYLALRKSQMTFKSETPDVSAWLQFFVNILKQQVKIAVSYLDQPSLETLLSPRQLAVWKYLENALEARPIQISKSTGVPRPTINQVMKKLLELKLVERIGQGSMTRYRKRA